MIIVSISIIVKVWFIIVCFGFTLQIFVGLFVPFSSAVC